LGPDPDGMDPKLGPKISPGRILIKPEALLRDLEYPWEGLGGELGGSFC
jgi:hypothetical protein